MAGLLERDRGRADEDRQVRRGPRNAQEARPKDIYFRDEYGWIMSDSDVAYEKDVEQQYTDERKRLKGEKKNAYKTFQTELSKGISQIRSAYNKQIGESKAPKLELPGTINFTAKTRPAKGTASGDRTGGLFQNQTQSKTLGSYAMPMVMINNMKRHAPGDLVKENGQWVFYTDTAARKNTINTFQSSWESQKKDLEKQHNTNMSLYNQAIKNLEDQREAEVGSLRETGAETWSGTAAQFDEAIKSVDYDDRKKIGQQQFKDRVQSRSDSIINQDAGLLQSPTNIVANGVKQNAEEQRAERKPKDVQ